jgi:hypothetical protein
MTIDWAFFGWTAGGTSTSAASGLALNSASALSFGGGARTAFQTNININEWNTALHYAKSTAESSIDYCPADHLWPIYPVAADFVTPDRNTAAYVAGTYTKMVNGDPDTAKGIGLRFRHTDFGVRCNPVYVWAGTGAAVTNAPESCYIAMADLSSSQPTWATVKPASKLSLKVHGTAATEHWWSVAIAVQPLQVGFNAKNKMRVETTYY